MVDYCWKTGKVPSNIPVRQVYGVAFSDDGKVLLRVEDGEYKLTGGKPEGKETFADTLKREYLEELNVEVDDISYLGYLLVRDGEAEYAQVRMIARIRKINEARPDADNGKLYGRKLAKPDDVKGLLGYSDEAGNLMIDSAIERAKQLSLI